MSGLCRGRRVGTSIKFSKKACRKEWWLFLGRSSIAFVRFSKGSMTP